MLRRSKIVIALIVRGCVELRRSAIVGVNVVDTISFLRNSPVFFLRAIMMYSLREMSVNVAIIYDTINNIPCSMLRRSKIVIALIVRGYVELRRSDILIAYSLGNAFKLRRSDIFIDNSQPIAIELRRSDILIDKRRVQP